MIGPLRTARDNGEDESKASKILSLELRIAELESQLKEANRDYQRTCDKLGAANRRGAKKHNKLRQIRTIIWQKD